MVVAHCFRPRGLLIHPHGLTRSDSDPAHAVGAPRMLCDADWLGVGAMASAHCFRRIDWVAWSILCVVVTALGGGVLNPEIFQRHVVLNEFLDHRAVFGEEGFSGDGDGSTQTLSELLVSPFQAEPKSKPLDPPPESARTKAIRARLDEAIDMPFPNETPLEEVLAYIKKATKKGPNDPGVPIYIDPDGFQEVGSTLTSLHCTSSCRTSKRRPRRGLTTRRSPSSSCRARLRTPTCRLLRQS